MKAVEELLLEAPLYRLSVSQICAQAGVSRQAFYNHFDSPAKVLEVALEEYLPEFAEAISPLLERDPDDDLDEVLSRSLENWTQFAAEHGSLLRSYLGEFHRNAEFKSRYMSILEATTARVAEILGEEASRRSGAPLQNVEAISAVIMLGFERTRLAVLADAEPGIRTLDELIDPLRLLFLGVLRTG